MLGWSLQLDVPLEHQYFSNPQDWSRLLRRPVRGDAGWYGLTARDRKRRFRLLPIAWTALLAAVLTPLWPYERPDGIAVALLVPRPPRSSAPGASWPLATPVTSRPLGSKTARSRLPDGTPSLFHRARMLGADGNMKRFSSSSCW